MDEIGRDVLSYAAETQFAPGAPLRTWMCRVDQVPRELLTGSAWLSRLSGEERQRHASFRFEGDRNLYLAAHVLLRAVLAEYTGSREESFEFLRNAHGRPELTDSWRPTASGVGSGWGRLRFSLSHAHGLALLAITAHGEIGADVEGPLSLDRAEELALGVLSSAEQRLFQRTGSELRVQLLLRHWTLKEAYAKAIGVGLSLEPATLTVSGLDSGPIQVSDASGPTAATDGWSLFSFALPEDCLGALAFRPDAQTQACRCDGSRAPAQR